MKNIDRILIFELNWLGDILFSLPFIRAIREAFPESYISCVVVPRYVDLLVHNPWINDVHTLSDDNSLSSFGEKLAFVKMIRKEKYDTCFLLKPSMTKTLMAAMSGISERIGFAKKNAPLTKEVKMPSDNLHRADQLLALAGAVGVLEADGTYEYFTSEENEDHADALLHEAGRTLQRIVAINPGGNWAPKRWPRGNYAELAKKLLARFKDIEVMVTGSGKDVELTQEIVSGVGDKRCYSVAGRTGLNELAVLFKKSDLVISADSGPLHLASAVGATTIGLFGPTSHKITGPRGRGENIIISRNIECPVPCYVEECERDHACMKSISADEVFRASEEVLSKSE